MNQRTSKENHQNIQTNYATTNFEVYPTLVLPTTIIDSSYSEDGKLVRVFTVSATNITNSVSLKAVGITKPFYYDASTSAQFLMGIYIPETPIELTAGEGFSFAFKWTEE